MMWINTRTSSRLRLGVLIAVTSMAVAGPAQAAETAADDSNFRTAEEQYAIEYGVSVTEATRRLDRVHELKNATQAIVAAEDGRIAGWGIVHEPEFGGWVYLVGEEAPSAATAEIDSQHDDVFVELGATYTLDELAEAMSDETNFTAISDAMWDRVAYREVDVRKNELVVALDREASPDLAAARLGVGALETLAVAHAASALEDELESSSELPFSVVVGGTAGTDDIYGGEHVDTADGKNCTSGFAVLDGATRGMLTAGHCGDGDVTKHWRSRTGSHSGSSYTATTRDSIFGEYGDEQWYTTSQHENDNFYFSASSNRDVTGRELWANMFGDWVCHYGISSGLGYGATCGTVVTTAFHPNYDECSGTCNGMWVKVESSTLAACGGDSGGPWFNSRTAYGIHSGSSPSGGACSPAGTDYAMFRAIDHVENALGVTLATS